MVMMTGGRGLKSLKPNDIISSPPLKGLERTEIPVLVTKFLLEMFLTLKFLLK